MDRFSFVMVLLSIIVGLGVTELLNNFARQIRNWSRAKFYWLHALLAILVFVALLQQWWESWQQRTVDAWSFPILILMLGGPIGLYLISHLLFPDDWEKPDFEKHYYRYARSIYGIGALTVVFTTIYRPISFRTSLFDADNAISIFVLLIFGLLAISKKKVLHETLVPLILIGVVLDVLLFHMSI